METSINKKEAYSVLAKFIVIAILFIIGFIINSIELL